jgi:hypothetical protein
VPVAGKRALQYQADTEPGASCMLVTTEYDASGNPIEVQSVLPEGAGFGDCPEDGVLRDRFSCKPECKGDSPCNGLCVLLATEATTAVVQCIAPPPTTQQPFLSGSSADCVLLILVSGALLSLLSQLRSRSLCLAQEIWFYAMSSSATTDTLPNGTPSHPHMVFLLVRSNKMIFARIA